MSLPIASAARLEPHGESASPFLLAALAALLAHVALGFLLALPPAPRSSADTEATPVEIISEADYAALQPRPTPAEQPAPAAPSGKPDGSLAAPPAALPAPAILPPSPPMIRAETMLSTALLADPRSGKARALLARTAPEERFLQLCGLEALAQIGAREPALKPDRVVAYALGDPVIRGEEILAEGAAFLAAGQWRRLAFRCRGSSDRRRIVAFAFAVGGPIPRRDRAAHNLPQAEARGDAD